MNTSVSTTKEVFHHLNETDFYNLLKKGGLVPAEFGNEFDASLEVGEDSYRIKIKSRSERGDVQFNPKEAL